MSEPVIRDAGDTSAVGDTAFTTDTADMAAVGKIAASGVQPAAAARGPLAMAATVLEPSPAKPCE